MLAALSSRSEDEIFLIAHRYYIKQGLQVDPEQVDPQQQSNLDATLSSRTTN